MSADFFSDVLPPPTVSLGLGAAGMLDAFPFHLGINSDLRVVQCGATVFRLLPELADTPLLSDLFEARGNPLPSTFAAFGPVCHRLSGCPAVAIRP